MAVDFIRKPSETPNIQNLDDIRMVRYAYGNQNGYIKGYGAELSHNATGSTFLINSGIFVIQGAEVKIDANGWSESVSGVTNKRYYTVYGEVNLALQTAEIKSTYNHAMYPTIEAGDDLTQSTDGTARVLLYRFTATNGIIADVEKVVKAIKYLSDFKTELSGGSFIVKNATNADNAVWADRAAEAIAAQYTSFSNAWESLISWPDENATHFIEGRTYQVTFDYDDLAYTFIFTVPESQMSYVAIENRFVGRTAGTTGRLSLYLTGKYTDSHYPYRCMAGSLDGGSFIDNAINAKYREIK